ncbi:UmoD family flagellar biogenesis regulator [Xenorhabdus littoralis]|uniref:UmoD family flagellar biogenesis regulator n=1 Tax=Xenorhabdus littoralis TaxID=2582835 RepID=UPI0029E7F877|nr:UmoD family flagellar biogenesis regulator [Xenorhabdus sp. psl]MDX7991347.1 UmoD [Xenorhabdus sp. psl]
MDKIKIKQYVIGFVITIAIIAIATIFYFKWSQPRVAQVLSSYPIKSAVTVHQSYCHISAFPIPNTVKNIEGGLLTDYEYRILFLLTSLKTKKEYPVLTHSALKNCVAVDFKKANVVGYDVIYVIGDKPGKVRIRYKPEEIIPLNEKGQLILKPHSEQ